MNDLHIIRVISLDAETPIIASRPGDYAMVVFGVGPQSRQFNVPLPVSRKDFDDADLISIARSYFAHLMEGLASQTSSWKLSPEQIDLRKKPQ